jgi:hypothetical protein
LGGIWLVLPWAKAGLVVEPKNIPRKTAPSLKTYSDGEGHILTEWQWMALPQKERERIEKLVDQQIKQILKGGTA